MYTCTVRSRISTAVPVHCTVLYSTVRCVPEQCSGLNAGFSSVGSSFIAIGRGKPVLISVNAFIDYRRPWQAIPSSGLVPDIIAYSRYIVREGSLHEGSDAGPIRGRYIICH